MRSRVLRVATLGATMIGLWGCSAPPSTQLAARADLPVRVDLRDRTPDLGAGESGYEVQQRRGRRYRFRRMNIAGRIYFIPYFAFQGYYLPNYSRLDSDWYYVYAYTGRNFSGRRRLIRIRRDRDRDRDWTDRNNWDRDWSGHGDWDRDWSGRQDWDRDWGDRPQGRDRV